MIKNIVFDFGGVLVDWNPHYLFDSYFNDEEKCNWFIENVCNARNFSIWGRCNSKEFYCD